MHSKRAFLGERDIEPALTRMAVISTSKEQAGGVGESRKLQSVALLLRSEAYAELNLQQSSRPASHRRRQARQTPRAMQMLMIL